MRRIQWSPFLNLRGRAREAMEYYQTVLGGKLELQTLDERGALRPAGPADRIHEARLEADGALLVGSDGHPDYPASVGNHMAIVLHGSDAERLRRAFGELAKGGRTRMPLTRQPSGASVGWLEDRFGNSWSIRIEPA